MHGTSVRVCVYTYICLQISPRCWVLQSFTYFFQQVDYNNRHARCHRYGRHHLWSINYNRIFNVNKLQMPKHPITPSASQLKCRTTNCANIRSGRTPHATRHTPHYASRDAAPTTRPENTWAARIRDPLKRHAWLKLACSDKVRAQRKEDEKRAASNLYTYSLAHSWEQTLS